METFFYIVAALLIASVPIIWYNKDDIAKWYNGGPRAIVSNDLSLAARAEKMLSTKAESLAHADVLEEAISKTRADLSAATSKISSGV